MFPQGIKTSFGASEKRKPKVRIFNLKILLLYLTQIPNSCIFLE
jgi:hypothetical protein